MNMEGCPGSRMMDRRGPVSTEEVRPIDGSSQLQQWPVQMHLVSPHAPYFQKADVLLSADCVAYACGSFHADHLKGKSLAIACPKLDEGQDEYIEKVKALIDEAQINTLTVMIMQVPCCRGLLAMAMEAARQASRKVPIKAQVVALDGEIIAEEWVGA
jgi:hypothetical protein